MKPVVAIYVDLLFMFLRILTLPVDIFTVPPPIAINDLYDPVEHCVIGSGITFSVSFIIKILLLDLPFGCVKKLNQKKQMHKFFALRILFDVLIIMPTHITIAST